MFTLPDVNPNLLQHLHLLAPERPSTILVPLCGRSVDLAYLAERKHSVVGIDAVAEPLRRIASDFGGGFEPISQTDGMSSFSCRRLPSLTLIHGDVFALLEKVPELRGACDGVWDRGGLTSIGGPSRARYLRILADSLKPGGGLLLEFLSCNIALEGTLQEADVMESLTSAGLAGARLLSKRDSRPDYPSFSPPGLRYLNEVVMWAQKHEATPPLQTPSEGGRAGAGVAAATGNKLR